MRTVTPVEEEKGGKEGGRACLCLSSARLSFSLSIHALILSKREEKEKERRARVPPCSTSLSLTFKGVVGDLAVKENGVKIVHPQPFFLARNCDPGSAVCVNHAVGVVWPGAVDGRVDDEARPVDSVRTRVDFPSTQVNLHKVQRRDFAIVKPERIDEKMRVWTGHAQSDMIYHLLVPAACKKDTIHAGEFHAGFPFSQGHAGGEGCFEVAVEEELGRQDGG